MTAFQKSRVFFIIFFASLPGYLLAGLDDSIKKHEISLNYLNMGTLKGHVSVLCSEQNDFCESMLEFEQDADYQFSVAPAGLRAMKFQGHFQRDINDSSELGSITVQKGSEKTRIPLSVDYDELPLGDKDNSITRAVITHLHPSIISHAKKELEHITEISDYLTGAAKNSETLHLFKPEPHMLSYKDTEKLANSINGDYLVLDIGESYSMVVIFNQDNIPESIYVLDRWKLYRDPIFKTIIGYGDLFGLVLHGLDFIDYGSAVLGFGKHAGHAHSFIGAGFHIAEIIDHTHGVAEFIYGGQKHYHDHDHGVMGDIFGYMHLGHTIYEVATHPSPAHVIQTVLTFASFGYHHVPHHYYEYSMTEVLRPVIHSQSQSSLDSSNLN
ncbi:hypothetical protein [Endozoicomonas atrinae]|uniref:hypothetical protein n=1 Tax=Endozoicomonas atrinae TaxID=1333660 RepID=UPI0008242BB7|nr:hypothetical protein [Endozoicomonas atrinae]